MVKSKDGLLLTNQDEIQKRWKEHFLEVLNRPAPEDTRQFEEHDGIPDPKIAVDAHKPEISAALKGMKNRAAGGVDGLIVEILTADLETSRSADILHYFLHEVWEQEQLPEDWSHGLI